MLAGLLCRQMKLGICEAAEMDGGEKPTPAGWCYDPWAGKSCLLPPAPAWGWDREGQDSCVSHPCPSYLWAIPASKRPNKTNSWSVHKRKQRSWVCHQPSLGDTCLNGVMLGKGTVPAVPPRHLAPTWGWDWGEERIKSSRWKVLGAIPVLAGGIGGVRGSLLHWRSGSHQSLLRSYGMEGTLGTLLSFSSKLSKALPQELPPVPRMLPFSPEIAWRQNNA